MEGASKKRLKSELLLLFTRKKLYIKPDLRITHLSEQLKTNRTYISKMINEEFHMNFNEFVNQYRVEEAKTLLQDPNHRFSTLDEIAEKSGFGSINSFSRIFKEKTGKTPNGFRKNMINYSD
jgi:YesN/AraC family two-component response regulator